jgi:two-component system, LytTR family, sensor kinase
MDTQPRPITWRDLGIYAVLWTIFGLLAATQNIVSAAYQHMPIDWGFVYSTALVNYWTCGIGTPLYIWLVRRFPLLPFDRRKAPIILLYLAAMAFCFVLKYIVWIPIENIVLHGHMSFRYSLVTDAFGVGLDQFYFVILLYAVENYRIARERELLATQLRSQLSQAQLDVLRSQLHPHFLFNTLNSISALMHRDVRAADEMLARLSDMLRLTLDAQTTQEVRLKDELAALDLYLQIMAVRFGDRLSTQVLVEEPIYDDRVPSFLLQPLVENAVRHGINESTAMTHVQIVGTADEATLTLRILDDGRGLPDKEMREGIGLRNTRRRLEQLYGEAGKLSIGNREGGGTEVVVQIPRRSLAWV